MSRYAYDSAAQPPQPYEVVEKAAAWLLGQAKIEEALGAGNVYAHSAPLEKPASGRWVVVRERIDNGGRAERADGMAEPVIQVMTECRRGTPNAHKWHSALHNRIAEYLIGWVPDLTLSAVELRMRRSGMPSAPGYDADDDTLYSTAEYSITLKPLEA